jgi:hypothetical protein
MMKISANGREKTVNRHDIDRSLHRLALIESDTQKLLHQRSVVRRATMVGRWYLPTAMVKRLILTRMAGGIATNSYDDFILRVSSFPLPRLLGALNPLSHRLSSLGADAVFLKNNIRAFYFQNGVTLKSSNPVLSSTTDGIANEIEVRSKIKHGRTIRVPSILHTAVRADRIYFIEQLLIKGRMLDVARDCDRLAKGLFEFYLKNGMIQRSLADVVLPDDLLAIRRLFVSLGYDSSGLLRFIDRMFVDRDPTQVGVPFGLSHGDMAVGNLLVEDELIYIVDWERAREAPVFADMSKLFMQVPGFQQQMNALFEEWNKSQSLRLLDEQDHVILGKTMQLVYLLQRYNQVTGTPEEIIAAPWLMRTLAARTKALANDLSKLVA